MGPMISDGTWRHHLGDVDLNRMCQLGTFAEYIVVHEASLIRIEPWYDLRAAALISCGISTGFGSAVNRGGVKPGDTVAVIGCGGRGFGRDSRAPCTRARARSIAIDTNQSKIDRALKIGATHGCATTLDAAFKILPELTRGKNCDVVVITVGVLTGELDRTGSFDHRKGWRRRGDLAIAPWTRRSVDLNLFMFAMLNQELRGNDLRLGEPSRPDPEAASTAPRGQVSCRRTHHPGVHARRTCSRATTISNRARTCEASFASS